MQIIINSNNVGIFLLTNCILTDTGVVFPDGSINYSYNIFNASIIDVDLPEYPVNNAYKWDGKKWVIYDQSIIDNYLIGIENQQIQINKQIANTLLKESDWTSVASIGDSQLSNPYLKNQSEFISWRSQIRAIAVNPIAGNLFIFNQKPKEIWQASTIPTQVSMRQARLALFQDGLLDQVQGAIDAMAEPAKTTTQISWDYATVVNRDDDLVVQLSAQLGLTNDDLDALFTLAATL